MYEKPQFQVLNSDLGSPEPRVGLFMVVAASAAAVYLVGAVVHAAALWVSTAAWTV